MTVMAGFKFWSTSFIYHPYNVFRFLHKNHDIEKDRYDFLLGGIELPTRKVVILRLDDVQEYIFSNVAIKIIDTVLNRNMAITLGLIPGRISHDTSIKKYISSKVDDPRIEIAQHGTYHDVKEHIMSESETYNITKLGMDTIIDILKIRPVTFIPPYNLYNRHVLKSLSRLGFKIISAEKDEYAYDGNIVHIGYTVPTAHKEKLLALDDILYSCNISLQEKNICVIMIHPQDYTDENNNLDEEKFKRFIGLLDRLSLLDVNFITFKDLIVRENNK